ncbi:hypothetical protein CAP36_11040 [Chitinophagaceae bacterium IBVUCB2]|nr:hypothetical protein CAP36_11040 [Chitinophagaceae bacterium IBVUCB2]
MKRLAFFCFLFASTIVKGQDTITYSTLLQSVSELKFTDSLQINAGHSNYKQLDSSVVKKWFSRLLPSGSHNRLKNRSYSITGKLTSHANFDLLFVQEEKKKDDTSNVQVVYLVSTKKDGTYISSLEVAVTGNRKRSFYNISSWLYKDYQIVQDNQIIVNDKSYGDMTYYKINGGGRFILSSNY